MEDIPYSLPAKPKRFMDRLRAFMCAKHLPKRTEKTCCGWIADYFFYKKTQNRNLKAPNALGFNGCMSP